MSNLKLYNAAGSSAAYRVRIALALKQLDAELIDVNLTDGSQHTEAYAALNPQRLIPALVDGETVLTQSLPILEYLDERYPQRPILPSDAMERAQQRALAHIVVSDIHPIQNLRVRLALARDFTRNDGMVDPESLEWGRYWTALGLASLEALAPEDGFLGGEQPMLADICLVPHMANARRFGVDMDELPKLVAIDARCVELPEFAR